MKLAQVTENADSQKIVADPRRNRHCAKMARPIINLWPSTFVTSNSSSAHTHAGHCLTQKHIRPADAYVKRKSEEKIIK